MIALTLFFLPVLIGSLAAVTRVRPAVPYWTIALVATGASFGVAAATALSHSFLGHRALPVVACVTVLPALATFAVVRASERIGPRTDRVALAIGLYYLVLAPILAVEFWFSLAGAL